MTEIDRARRISSFSNEPVERPKVPMVDREHRSGFDMTGWLVRVGIAPSRSAAVFILIAIMVASYTCMFLVWNWVAKSTAETPTRAQMDASMRTTMGDRANSTLKIQ